MKDLKKEILLLFECRMRKKFWNDYKLDGQKLFFFKKNGLCTKFQD